MPRRKSGAAETVVTSAMIEAALRPLRWPRLRNVLGKAMHWSQKSQIEKRYDRFALEFIHGTPIVVMPGVFNPKLLRTGEYFASQINAAVLGDVVDVLDVGTGSGVCAIFAARLAQRVVAVDINREAVRCARINALLNNVEDRVDARSGDLFAPVGDAHFDVVLFNPPFLRGVPGTELDCAWRSTDVAERFAGTLRSHLKATGFALVLLSTFGGATVFIDELRKQRFELSVLATRRFVNERLVIVCARAQ